MAYLADGLAVGPVPKIAVKAAPFLLYLSKHSGIGHRRLDLQPVADDAGIVLQSSQFIGIVGADFLNINPSNAREKASRFLRIHTQESPA